MKIHYRKTENDVNRSEHTQVARFSGIFVRGTVEGGETRDVFAWGFLGFVFLPQNLGPASANGGI
jgi:hypothetical protein